jgi:hypothetical protein
VTAGGSAAAPDPPPAHPPFPPPPVVLDGDAFAVLSTSALRPFLTPVDIPLAVAAVQVEF